MKATLLLVSLTASIATLLICSEARALKLKVDLTPNNFKPEGFTVVTTKSDGDMVNITITRDLSKARSFPADSNLRLGRDATLEIVGPNGAVARCNLQGEENASSVRYTFTIARDYLAHSRVTVAEIDDYKENLLREHLLGGGTLFDIKLSDISKP